MPSCSDMHAHLRIYQQLYDGCGGSKKFKENYAFVGKKGGLVTARHDKIRHKIRNLLAHMLSSSRIRYEPMFNPALVHISCPLELTNQAHPLHPTFGMPIAKIY